MGALRHRDFRIFWIAQFASFVGTWMQVTTLSWLAYRLTNSPFQLGMISFVNQFPVFLFGLGAGVLADRFDHRKLLFVNESAAMAQAAVLAALVFSGRITLLHIYALAALSGITNAVDFPVRQVFVGGLVPADERSAAIALNSGMVNAARIIGPAAAGVLIASVGEWPCFALNALSYAATIAALYFVKGKALEARAAGRPAAEALEGLRFALRTPVKTVLILVAVMSAFGMPYIALLPLFAEEALRAGPRGLGFMTAWSGAGAAAGALWLAHSKSADLGLIVARAALVFSAALGAFALSRAFSASCAALFAVGASMIVVLAGSNSLLQQLASENYRGRMMSLYMMLLFGLSPLGSLVAGAAAGLTGASAVVVIGAGICGIASLLVLRNPVILPVFREVDA